MNRGAIHPNLYDRLLAAGVQPSYERPQPPTRGKSLVAVVAVLLGVILGFGLVQTTPRDDGDGGWSLFRLATQPDEPTVANYALARFRAGDTTEAAALYRACAALFPGAYCPANLAMVQTGSGHCDDARQAAAEAQARLNDSSGDAERDLVSTATGAARGCHGSRPGSDSASGDER